MDEVSRIPEFELSEDRGMIYYSFGNKRTIDLHSFKMITHTLQIKEFLFIKFHVIF